MQQQIDDNSFWTFQKPTMKEWWIVFSYTLTLGDILL